MSSYASQLHEEQQAVDRAYGRLDDLRAEMWQRLDTVRAAGSHGIPHATQRTRLLCHNVRKPPHAIAQR